MINKLNSTKISPKIIIWHFTFLGQRSSSHVRSMKSIILKYEWLFYVIRKYILSSPQTNQLIGIWWPYYKVQCHQKPLKSFFHSLFVFKDIDNRVFFFVTYTLNWVWICNVAICFTFISLFELRKSKVEVMTVRVWGAFSLQGTNKVSSICATNFIKYQRHLEIYHLNTDSQKSRSPEGSGSS